MDTSHSDQFKKLTDSEKGKIINELVLNPLDIICKSKDDLFVVKPFSIKPILKLSIRFLQKEPTLRQGEEIIGQFLMNNQNLFIFKCDFGSDNTHSFLTLNSDFYMIQRRENYRVSFPSTLQSKVIINKSNETFTGRVVDLSTSGIRVGSTENPNFISIGCEIDMKIDVVGHQPLTIKAHLRHHSETNEAVKGKKNLYHIFGFEFIDTSLENEKNLSRINMELYRTFLSKVNT